MNYSVDSFGKQAVSGATDDAAPGGNCQLRSEASKTSDQRSAEFREASEEHAASQAEAFDLKPVTPGIEVETVQVAERSSGLGAYLDRHSRLTAVGLTACQALAYIGLVLEAGPELSRRVPVARLSRITGLSRLGIYQILTRLQNAGIIEKTGDREHGPHAWRFYPWQKVLDRLTSQQRDLVPSPELASEVAQPASSRKDNPARDAAEHLADQGLTREEF